MIILRNNRHGGIIRVCVGRAVGFAMDLRTRGRLEEADKMIKYVIGKNNGDYEWQNYSI